MSDTTRSFPADDLHDAGFPDMNGTLQDELLEASGGIEYRACTFRWYDEEGELTDEVWSVEYNRDEWTGVTFVEDAAGRVHAIRMRAVSGTRWEPVA